MGAQICRFAIPVLCCVFLAACPADQSAERALPEAKPDAPPAVSPAAGDLPPGVTAEMIASGQQLYGTVCVACHGAAGVGTPLGPALNDQDWIHIQGELDEIVQLTEAGVTQPRDFPAPMPRMGGAHFSPQQLRAIGAYVYALSRGQI